MSTKFPFLLWRDSYQKEGLEIHTYRRAEDIFYCGHIPHLGLVLLGGMLCMRRGGVQLELPLGGVIGVPELLLRASLSYTVSAYPGARVGLLFREEAQAWWEGGRLAPPDNLGGGDDKE